MWIVKFNLEAVLQSNGVIESNVKKVTKKQFKTTYVDLIFSRIKLWLTLVEFKWERVIILRLLLTPRAWKVVLVCPHSISDFAIINYTDVAATSPVKLGFLKSKWIFAEFGHCHEEKISALSASFKKLNQLRRATRKGEGGRFPLSFLKIDKKYPNFGK